MKPIPMEETVIVTYRVKPGQEVPFRDLLREHWPTLRRLGLATPNPPQYFHGTDPEKNPIFIEIFTWKDGAASEAAHEAPEVMRIWERMGALVEARLGRPAMEFPHVQPLLLGAGSAP